MIFLRAIPFSFAILWRYAIALPILIIAMIMFGIVAVVPTLIITLIAPFLGLLVILACSIGVGIVPILVGTRVGMQAKEHRPTNTYFGMMLPAVGYGMFEAICALVITVAAVAAFIFFTPLTLDDFQAIDGSDGDAVIALLLESSPAISWGLFIGSFALLAAVRACLLMPLTGASIGADPSGRAHTPFYGVGSGFASLFPLVVVSQVGTYLVIPIVVLLSIPLGIAESLNAKLDAVGEFNPMTDMPLFFGTEAAIFVGLCLFFFLFFFSLQCAGGVLVYLRHVKAVEQKDEAYAKSVEKYLDADQPAQPKVDAMELVRSRMQNRDR